MKKRINKNDRSNDGEGRQDEKDEERQHQNRFLLKRSKNLALLLLLLLLLLVAVTWITIVSRYKPVLTQSQWHIDDETIPLVATSQSLPGTSNTRTATKTTPATTPVKSEKIIVDQPLPINDSRRSVCDRRYKGILWISNALPFAATGTLFFQSILNCLLYAQAYNLYPWVHINSQTQICYDPNVHGGPNTASHNFSHLSGVIDDLRVGIDNISCYSKTGGPGFPNDSNLVQTNYSLVGNGIWASYFEPVGRPPSNQSIASMDLTSPSSSFSSCWNQLPLFQLSDDQFKQGLHRCSKLAVRAWPNPGLPPHLLPAERNGIHDWLWNQNRRLAFPIVQKYFKPLPWLKSRIDQANPVANHRCLAVHIRLTDKGHGRKKKNIDFYLPYAIQFANLTQHRYPIYVATDDARIIPALRSRLHPTPVLLQPGAARSDFDDKPVFELLSNDAHRSNTEALIEIYAMAKCGWFLHGYSAMAEAVVYLQPKLHNQSVNVDDPFRPSPRRFRRMMKNRGLEGSNGVDWVA